jgi:hypothetical protein
MNLSADGESEENYFSKRKTAPGERFDLSITSAAEARFSEAP